MALQVEALTWIAGYPPVELEKTGAVTLQMRPRHGPTMKQCVLQADTSSNDDAPFDDRDVATGERRRVAGMGRVFLDGKDSGLAPGQFVAFYRHCECLGAGVISDSVKSGPSTARRAPPAERPCLTLDARN